MEQSMMKEWREVERCWYNDENYAPKRNDERGMYVLFYEDYQPQRIEYGRSA